MKKSLAWRSAALFAFTGLGLATSALADDKVVKIGVLTDMSSLYADINGPGAVTAVNMAIDDSGMRALSGIDRMPALPSDWRGQSVDVTFDFDLSQHH